MTTIKDIYFNQIKQEYQAMSDLVTQQMLIINNLLQGYQNEDNNNQIKKNEMAIDQYEIKIRELIINTIVLQNPKAGDLRCLMSCFNMIIDLERIGDLMMSIYRRMDYLLRHQAVYEYFKVDIIEMFEVASQMYDNAVFAFVCANTKVARNVIELDEKVDDYYKELHSKLFSFNKLDDTKHDLADILDISRIVYAIERIGDSATNISEAVVFFKEGIDIKHIQSQKK